MTFTVMELGLLIAVLQDASLDYEVGPAKMAILNAVSKMKSQYDIQLRQLIDEVVV